MASYYPVKLKGFPKKFTSVLGIIFSSPDPQVTNCRVEADIIVSDSEQPGLRNQLAMMIVGGAIMQTSMLLGGHGTLLCYKKLTRTPKWVHMTGTFKTEFPGAAAVISSFAFLIQVKVFKNGGTPKAAILAGFPSQTKHCGDAPFMEPPFISMFISLPFTGVDLTPTFQTMVVLNQLRNWH